MSSKLSFVIGRVLACVPSAASVTFVMFPMKSFLAETCSLIFLALYVARHWFLTVHLKTDATARMCHIRIIYSTLYSGDSGSTVLKVLCYNSDGRWFDPSWCQWNFSLT